MKKIAIFLTFALTACGGTKVKVDADGMAQAKKVAIVGFHLSVEEPKSVIGDFNKLKDLGNGKVDDAVKQTDTADQAYQQLAARLSQEMGWNVKTANDVKQSKAYAELETEFTKGLQIRGMQGQNFHTLRPHGIIDAEPFVSKITQARREKLMDDLGVNTIVADFVIASLKNESTFGGMVGRAKYKPKTQNIIRVYVKGKKDSVWFDSWAWGDGDEAIQASMNYIADDALMNQVKVAFGKSLDETFKRYKNR